MVDAGDGAKLRWRLVEKTFEGVLELEGDGRARALAELRARDPGLADEVEGLLEADGAGDEFLERPDELPPVASFTAPEGELDPGARLGAWRVESLLATGGMGHVYLADRVDEEFEKRVAIKVVKRGMDTGEVVRRFRAERQTLAHLEHPNIARLLDGGVTEDGRPFLVMEYVEGRTIDRWCVEEELSVRERLRLFCRVCDAVEHAHRRLVIHRDLKPANILVGEDGEPKLLDFGIAKVLESGDELARPTRIDERPMTPEYASPEQVLGEPVTTATDVYSLGVVLYELLTDRRPYDVPARTPLQVHRAVCETDPAPPSAAAARRHDPRLRRRLSGDLDRIALKSLRKEPERRYASVRELAEDVERHLGGYPVLARADSRAYRASKWIRRNLGVSLVGLALLLSLIAGSAGTAWKAHVARQEAARAQQEASTSRLISELVSGILASARPAHQGSSVFLLDLLENASARIETDCAGNPEVEASIRSTVGRSYYALGSYEVAETHLRRARELREELEPRDSAELARARLDLGRLLTDLGEYAEAEALVDAARTLFRAAGPTESAAVADADLALSALYAVRGEFEAAEEAARRGHAMRRELLGELDLDTAQALSQLGSVLYERGAYREADETFARALATLEELLGPDDPRIAADLDAWGRLEFRFGDPERAGDRLARAVEIRRARLEPDHPALGSSLTMLGRILVWNDHPGADPVLREAEAIFRASLGPDHPDLAEALDARGTVCIQVSDFDGAEVLHSEALDILTRKFGRDHLRVAETLERLARVHRRRGPDTVPEAIELLRESLEIKRNVFGAGHPDLFDPLGALAVLHQQTGELAASRPLLEERVGVARAAFRLGDRRTATALRMLGSVECRLDDHGRCLALLEQALAEYRAIPDCPGDLTGGVGIEQAACLLHLGRVDEAEPLSVAAFEEASSTLEPGHPLLRVFVDRLAKAAKAIGEPELAARYRGWLTPGD